MSASFHEIFIATYNKEEQCYDVRHETAGLKKLPDVKRDTPRLRQEAEGFFKHIIKEPVLFIWR